MIITTSPFFRSDLVVWGYLDPVMSSLILHVSKLIYAIWPVALNSNDFVDSM